MKVEMSYVDSVEIGEVELVKTPQEKEFYKTKIVIKTRNEVMTLIIMSMEKENIDIANIVSQQKKLAKKQKKDKNRRNSNQLNNDCT